MSERRRTLAIDLRALVPAATGIGVYTRELTLALANRGSFDLLGLAHRPPRGADDLAAAGMAIEHQAAPLGVLWQQLRLPRRLAAGDADLFWSPLGTLPWRSPLPSVITVHDLTVLLYPEAHTAKVRWSQLPFFERSLRDARRILVPSHATARDLAFHFPETAGAVRVIEHGVGEEFRPGDPEVIERTRAELGAPDGYILYTGTLEPRKNVEGLLDAWEDLRAESPDTPPLILAGGFGWGGRQLPRRIEALRGEGVTHLGYVERDRLVRLFQAARLFVYPSLYEGFGMPPLEAMACGVPVIASSASSLPEVVGDAGLLVSPQDGSALRQALSRVLDDPELEADLGARSLRRSAGFTWDAAARAFEQVLDEALGDDDAGSS